MHIAMERDERILFESFVNCSQRFLEFGAGGSTWLAARREKEWLVSVDSSQDWLDKVADETRNCLTRPLLEFVDIGPIKEWGFPVGERKSHWSNYHELVWRRDGLERADLFFIDGRFRVACALQCLLRATDGALLGIHDFERPYYHVILDFARSVASSGRLSFFQRLKNFDPSQALALLEKFRFDPA
jgi:hypothetical protein